MRELAEGLTDAVEVKGSRRGLYVVIDEDAPFDRVLEAVRRKLGPARRFFAGAPARLEPGNRVATWQQWMQLVSSLRACGLCVQWEAGDGDAPSGGRAEGEAPEAPRAVVGSARLAVDPSQVTDGLRWSRRFARQAGARTMLVRHTLRSGQRVAFDGHLVILGDVNPGAEVIASGDIVVVGALRGVAHAGARGDEKAVVVALDLRPLQLRIAHRVARAPDGGSEAGRGPELACIRGDRVEVRPYA